MDKVKSILHKWLIVITITTVLGIIFIAIYFANSPPRNIYIEIIGTIGKTILGSGVFLAILKSIQFSGVFEDELRKIIYSDDVLRKRNDIHDIWKKVTRAIYQSAFPLITTKLEDVIQRKLLSQKLNYYHKDVHVIYEINKFDEEHFELIESQNFIIISNGDSFTFELTNEFIKLNDSTDLSKFEICELLINNESFLDNIIKSEEISLEDNQIGSNIDCSINLNGSKEYHVKKVTKTLHTNKLNGYWKYEIGRITESFTIDIRNNGLYELDLIPMGNNTELKKIFVSSTLNINKHYDLMIPGDGFILLIKPRLR